MGSLKQKAKEESHVASQALFPVALNDCSDALRVRVFVG